MIANKEALSSWDAIEQLGLRPAVVAEIVIQVLGLHAPMMTDRVLESAANGPAYVRFGKLG